MPLSFFGVLAMPVRELKAAPFHVKKVAGSEVTGVFSVLGNLDDYNDKGWPGMFTKTFQERGTKILHLWQHDFSAPPIALIKGLRELTREELPADVLAQAPEALGGAEVVREYLNTPRALEVLENIKAGVPLQMSFAYDAVRYDYEELPGAKYEWEKQRNLREVRLWETSDVLWGANSATVASKASLPLDFLIKQMSIHLLEWQADFKSGRRNAAGDQERINTIASLALELGADNVKLAAADAETAAEDSDKVSRLAAEAAEQAAAATEQATKLAAAAGVTPGAEDSDRSGDASSRAAEQSAPTALAYRQRLELASRAIQLAQFAQR
jgi:HK97 family phage prohead protease